MPETMSSRSPDGEDGFTLIEALVALAVTAAGLAAIATLGFGALSAAQRAEGRVFLSAAARSGLAALAGPGAGGDVAVNGAALRAQSSPFPFDAGGAPLSPAWTPQALRLVVTDARGARLIVDTVKLTPAGARR